MPVNEYIDTDTDEELPFEGASGRVNVNSSITLDSTEAAKAGNFYSFTSIYSADDDDYTAYLRNDDSTLDLHVVAINVSSKVETTFSVYKSEGAGSGGTEPAPLNWNFSSSNTADVEFRQDPSNGSVTPVTIMDSVWLPDSGKHTFNFYGSLILGDGDAIAVQVGKGDDDTTTVIIGYFA